MKKGIPQQCILCVARNIVKFFITFDLTLYAAGRVCIVLQISTGNYSYFDNYYWNTLLFIQTIIPLSQSWSSSFLVRKRKLLKAAAHMNSINCEANVYLVRLITKYKIKIIRNNYVTCKELCFSLYVIFVLNIP